MKTINEMKCTFPSLSVNEAYARTAVTAFAAQLDLTIEEIADIRTAVSEAVTNAIVHGYRGTVGTIELCVKLLEGNEVYIRIKDCGCGIPDVAQAMEPLYTTAAAEERAGLGFAVAVCQKQGGQGHNRGHAQAAGRDGSRMSAPCSQPRAEENLGLVHLCANRFRGRGVEYDDLYSAGCIGLMKAVNAFDTERGVRFSTYAVPVILGEIKRLFRDGGTVKVSRSMKELSMRVVRLRDELRMQSGKEPTVQQLAKEMGVEEAEIVQALCVSVPPVDRKSTRLNSSHYQQSRMPSSA